MPLPRSDFDERAYEDDFFAPTDLEFVAQPTTAVAPVTTAAPAVPAPPAWQSLAKTFTEQWQRAGIDPVMSGIDRAEELGKILANYGITDLSKLGLKETPYSFTETGVDVTDQPYERLIQGVNKQLTYGDKAFGYLGGFGSKGQEEFGTQPYGLEEYMQDPNLLAWSAAGHGNVSYRTVQGPDGQVYIVPEWGSSSDWGDVRNVAKLAATVASMGGAGAALGASLLPAGVSTAVSGALGLAPTAFSTAVGNAILGGIASGKPEGALMGGVASLLAPVVTTQVNNLLGPASITGTEVIDNAIKSVAQNVTNAAVKSIITTGDMPNIEGIIQNTLLNEAASELQNQGLIPKGIDTEKAIKVAETVNKVIGGGELTPSEFFGLVSNVGSSLPKTPGEKTPAGAATEPTAITAGEDVEEIPEEYQEPDYEQIAAGLPADLVTEQRYEEPAGLTDAQVEEILYGLEPGQVLESMSQQELEDYVKQIEEPQKVSDQDIEDILQSIAVTSEPLPAGTMEDVPFLGETVSVTGKRELDQPPFDALDDLFGKTQARPEDVNLTDLVNTGPEGYKRGEEEQRIEIPGKRLQEQEFVSVDSALDKALDTATKLPENIVKLIENPPAPQVVEVVGKKELDQPPLDVLDSLFGKTDTRTDDINLTDLINTGPEEDKRGEETQRVDVTAKKPAVSPIDLDFDIKEPGPLIEPPETLPKEIEKIITTPPVVEPPKPEVKPPIKPAVEPPKPPKPPKEDDLSWLFALLGMLGGQQQKPEQYQVADVRGARSPFGSLLDETGSQDDLLRILRG